MSEMILMVEVEAYCPECDTIYKFEVSDDVYRAFYAMEEEPTWILCGKCFEVDMDEVDE